VGFVVRLLSMFVLSVDRHLVVWNIISSILMSVGSLFIDSRWSNG